MHSGLKKNKQRTAKVGATRIAQSTNRMELILMFKRMYFGIKCMKTYFMLGFEPLPVDSLVFKRVITKKIGRFLV